MYKKIFQILCVVGFFIVFGYFYGDRYWQHQEVQKNFEDFQNSSSQYNRGFSLKDIQNIEGNTKLYITPNTFLLDQLVAEIDAASSHVLLEMYIFTEKRIRQALIDAHRRGVRVQVLLENNPYRAPYLNDGAYNELLDAGVEIKWSDPLLYSLNHSKFLIIDTDAYISTGNFSYSLFTKNKDFLLKLQDKNLVKALIQLFELDFSHRPGGVHHSDLVISPYMSRDKLEHLVNEAQSKIQFYFPYLADEGFETLLSHKAQGGVHIEGIVEKGFYTENPLLVEKLQHQGVNIQPLQKYKLHAKAILVDGKYLYLGSINFSKYSFDENREIGIILSKPKIISEFRRVFENDFFK